MKKVLFVIFIFLSSLSVNAQAIYGTTGLLHMPTADMQRDKTFMIGGSYLHHEATPKHWFYNTYNYYLNITFFPWLEVAYLCTLNQGVPGKYWPEKTWGKFVNQDRMFSVRLRAIEEGQFWKHMPSIVLGANDALTKMWEGGSLSVNEKGNTSNGYWARYYIAATKHFDFQGVGNLGVHAAYVYNNRISYPLNGPALGANFQLALPEDRFVNKALNGVNLMAEYDSRTINVGMGYTIWKDHINLVAELNECKYLSAGVYFKVHLK